MLWIGYVFLFYILYLPVTHNDVKGWFILALVLAALVRAVRNRRRLSLDKSILRWLLFYILLGVAYILLGIINDAPGALFSSLVFILWPLVYVLFIAATANRRTVGNFLRIMVLATTCIGLGTLYSLLWYMGWVPDSLYFDPGLVDHVAFLGGSIQMVHYSLSSLTFLIPFVMASIFIYPSAGLPFVSKNLLWFALSTGFLSALVGGRRALMLVLLLAPALILYFRSWLPSKLRPDGTKQAKALGCIVIALLGLGLYLGRTEEWSWKGVGQLFLSGFDFNYDPNAEARREQFFALLRGWMRHPLIGEGLGAGVPEVIRNDERPWQYELQYVLLLYQVGVIGMLLYASGVLWIYSKTREMIRSGSPLGVHMVPLSVGMTCFLIANAADPYLQTFGHLWALFLPVALINLWLVSGRSPKSFAKSPNVQATQPRCPHPSTSSLSIGTQGNSSATV